jgi:hypothetical protein
MTQSQLVRRSLVRRRIIFNHPKPCQKLHIESSDSGGLVGATVSRYCLTDLDPHNCQEEWPLQKPGVPMKVLK